MPKINKLRICEAQLLVKPSFHILGKYIQDRITAEERHYHNKEELLRIMSQIDDEYLGTLEKDGHLQEELNRTFRNILVDLKTDHPGFTRKRMLVYSLTAGGLPNELIQLRAQLPYKGTLYTMRSLIIRQIEANDCPRRDEYLSLLGR